MPDFVAVTQPYVPAYRVPLFDAIASRLAEEGLELRVYSSAPTGGQSIRGDASRGSWQHDLPGYSVPIGKWRVPLRALPEDASKAVAVVSELEALNVLAWRELVKRRPLILWGHGKGYVNDTGALSDRVEWTLARRASHVMTYAESGRNYLIDRGSIRSDRVTAIGNSTDTETLRTSTVRQYEQYKPDERQPRALYVGGLDASKRVDFLLEAFQQARMLSEGRFELTVVGRGSDAAMVEKAARENDGLRYVPEARGEDLAKLGTGAQVMWVPGRVGLVAVDALAMGLPVHTTQFAYHAPEIEFLQRGEVEYLGPSPRDFASQSLSLMSRQQERVFRQDIPTIASVSQNFTNVVLKTLN